MNTIQPYVSTLPTEMRIAITKEAHEQHANTADQTIRTAPAESIEASKKARAKAEIRFGLLGVSREFREAALSVIDPGACAHFVKDQVSKLARETKDHDGTIQFKEGVGKLVNRYPGVDFDFSQLSPAQLEACLTVLKESRGGHLKEVTLDFSQKHLDYPQRTSLISKEHAETFLLPALKALAENHPRARTSLLLSNCNLLGTTCDFGALGAVAKLDLDTAKLDKKTLIDIFRDMRNSSIEALNLNNTFRSNSLDEEAMQELACAIQSTPDLRFLAMANAFADGSSDACARVLTKALGKTRIEYLDVGENEIAAGTGESAGIVSIMKNLPQTIVSLDISRNSLADKLHHVASEVVRNRIVAINLRGCEISGAELERNVPGEYVSVARKLLNSSVQCILFDENGSIGDSGATAIAQAIRDTGVRELGLVRCEIGDDGFSQIASAMPSCSVTTLDLRHNSLGPDGVEALCLALENPRTKLSSVNLSETDLFPENGIEIAAAAALANRPITLTLPNAHFSVRFVNFMEQKVPQLDLKFA